MEAPAGLIEDSYELHAPSPGAPQVGPVDGVQPPVDNGAEDAEDIDDEAEPVYPDECEADTISLEEIVQKNMSRAVRDLRTFFDSGSFVTEKRDPTTNIINVSSKRTYRVPNDRLEEFFQLLDACRREKRMLHYSERQETDTITHTGIMIDFDRFQRGRDREINAEHFGALNSVLVRILMSCLENLESTPFFHIFYICKPAVVPVPERNGIFKDGFHVLIPEVQVTRPVKRYVLAELADKLAGVFKSIDHIDSAAAMLDRQSACNPVYFLGGSKPGRAAYPLTHAYKVTLNDGWSSMAELDVDLLLSGRAKRGGGEIPINLTYELALGAYYEALDGQPTWLAKRPYNAKPELAMKLQMAAEKADGGVPEEEIRREEEELSLTNINNPLAKYVHQLLCILDIKYATSYELWFKVICAVAHTGVNEDYKHIAREFSKRRPQAYSAAEFDRVWAEATAARVDKRPTTLRSIKYWAMQSAPAVYREVEKEHYGNILRRAAYDNMGVIEHATVAKLTYAMCMDKFTCDVGHNDATGRHGYCWYEFVTPGQAMRRGEIYKWRKELEPDNIHLFMGDHLPKVYGQVRDNIKDRIESATNENDAKYWGRVAAAFARSRNALGSDGYQSASVKQARYRFRQRGFIEELDTAEDIIGVGNGVLKIGAEPMLIKGYHEYKVSKFTETDYVPFDPNYGPTQRLLTAFRDIFPEPDVFNYMMIHAATGLDFCESSCILTLLIGGGRNGKTFLAKMVHNTLGNQYCAAGKSALLTAPLERGENANSAQMQQKDKRWFYIDEFNKCELLNTGRVKMMVTPSWQSGRDLHSRQTNFKNTANTICLSNFDFIVDTSDHGTWRRIYYYRNKVRFCENPDPANPYEKRVDRRFLDEYTNDPVYRSAMLSIMVHYYGIYCREYGRDLSTVPVPTIRRETEAFRNRQDAVNQFITQYMVCSPNAPDLGLPTVATRYIDWYKRSIKQTQLTINDVAAQFENSRLASSIINKHNVLHIVGHRLRAYEGEPLQEGESHVGERPIDAAPEQPTAPLTPTVEPPVTSVEAPTADKKEPPVIPRADNVSDAIIDIDPDILAAMSSFIEIPPTAH